jgi:hypothetical protein
MMPAYRRCLRIFPWLPSPPLVPWRRCQVLISANAGVKPFTPAVHIEDESYERIKGTPISR